MAAPLALAAIPAAVGLAQSVTGLVNRGKAQREAERLAASRPQLEASPYVQEGLDLAEAELAQGMSAGATRAYEEGLDRDVSSALSTILRGGGNVNNVADIFDASSQGRQRMTLMRENLRLNQLNNLARAQQAAEEQRQQRFEFNQWRPFADRAQANAAARQGAEGQIWSGINTVGSAAMQYGNMMEGRRMFDRMYPDPANMNFVDPVTPASVGTNLMPTRQGTPGYMWTPPAQVGGLMPIGGFSGVSTMQQIQ